MIVELQILVCSYLELEEILHFTKNNHKLRDTIIGRYHQTLPSLDTCCQDGNLEMFIYLYDRGYKYNPHTIITTVLRTKKFRFLKFILTNILASKEIDIIFVDRYMTIETIKFLQKYGVKVEIDQILFQLLNDSIPRCYEIAKIIKSFNVILQLYILNFSDENVYNYLHKKYIKNKRIMHWTYDKGDDLSFMEYLI